MPPSGFNVMKTFLYGGQDTSLKGKSSGCRELSNLYKKASNLTHVIPGDLRQSMLEYFLLPEQLRGNRKPRDTKGALHTLLYHPYDGTDQPHPCVLLFGLICYMTSQHNKTKLHLSKRAEK